MTFWYAHDMSGWGWFGMSVGMVAFWALIITALVLVFRAVNRPHEHTHTPAAPTPQHILGERFARGEIDEEEYRRRLSTLDSGPLTKT
ncbi:SHOCT domain-containing protein [Streptomyces blattellae]|uniref:SHOCT domain-containing protein n=1 Tax=Streptomyces blattellae TaxID=2569855 RepID=UPI0012B7D082|nr:SHOCT domain-containing protein [Streptomyces blattellae]